MDAESLSGKTFDTIFFNYFELIGGRFSLGLAHPMLNNSSMQARRTTCRVLENVWVTPTVFRLRFVPIKMFTFQPGQFVSVVIPPDSENPKSVKRCYSLSSSPEEVKAKGYYELCIKYVWAGRGTSYLAAMTMGDTFEIYAPYGDMKLQPPAPGRSVCFIGTATGIAPLRSMAFSDVVKKGAAKRVTCILGVRTEDEILYQKDFEKTKVDFKIAVSQPTENWKGFHGRVTDLIQSLPTNWGWHTTDFYLCGNGEMVTQVAELLEGVFGVKRSAIHREAFFPSHAKTNEATQAAETKRPERALFSLLRLTA